MSVRFNVLGPFEVDLDGVDRTPTAPKPRQVLALLALHPNQVVQMGTFIEELWGDEPPLSATATLQTYIYQLRKLLHDKHGGAETRDILVTKRNGYAVAIDTDAVDLFQFDRLFAQGRSALEADDPARAVTYLHQALKLWRGPVLGDLETGPVLAAQITRLNETRLHTLEQRIEAEQLLGRARELIGELRELVATHPLKETFQAQLMLALYRCGRRSEALEVYGRLRDMMVEQLGVEPCARVQRLHHAILSADPSLDHEPERIAVEPRMVLTTPAQLPPDIMDFTGREQALAQVTDVLDRTHDDQDAMRIGVITGPVGVGKSALAVRSAQRLREQYPDGQLYADLRSPAGAAHPAEILATFLRSVGLPDSQVPPSLEDRIRLFRSWTANRDVLVVLDDAQSTEQVRALLPSGGRCGALVTSRRQLCGIPGSQSIVLGTMSMDEGLRFLERCMGRARGPLARPIASSIVRYCGFLPLALRCAGARLAARQHWPMERLASALADEHRRLAELRADGIDVAAALASTYDDLDDDEQRAFRRLSVVGPEPFGLSEAAVVMGTDIDEADALIGRLVEHHLVEEIRGVGDCDVTYRYYELLRVFAKERLYAEEPDRVHFDGTPEPVAFSGPGSGHAR